MTLQMDLLEEIFDLVLVRGDGLSEEFYRRAFARAPRLRDLFAGVPMSLQRLKFVSTLVLLRMSLRDIEAVTPELEALGARHVGYGALPEHYPILGEVLLDALAALGGQRWTSAHAAAWVEFYACVEEAMLRGAAVTASRADTSEAAAG